MAKRLRTRVFLFGALALLAALLPATLAFGTHSDFSGIVPGGVVILEMGNSPTADKVVFGSASQSITTSRSNCTTVDASFVNRPLLNINEGGTGVSLGEAKDQIGVQSSSDGNGENCVRTGVGETMTITLGSNFASGTVMGGFDLDVQLKFNSVIGATTTRGGVIQDQFSFTGEGLSDSGPDSEDNRRWAYIADGGKEFDTLVLTANVGTFSIGGGKNIAEPGVFVTSSRGSQFAIGPIFDGEITCGDAEAATIDDPNVPQVVGEVTMEALNLGTWDANCTIRKPFTEGVTSSSLTFIPEGDDPARYTLILKIKDQPIMTEDGVTTSLVMEYNDGTFGSTDQPLEPCLKAPQDSDYVVNGNNGLLPSGETACYYFVSLTPTAPGFGDEEWKIYFEDDPNFSFR